MLLVLIVTGVMLIADVLIWAGQNRIFTKESSLLEKTLTFLGSWPALVLMGSVSIGWAIYEYSYGKPAETLDLAISIFTMLLDGIVLMGWNYSKEHDSKLLKDILKELKDK